MSELEEKRASVMNDPAMMQKIMGLAQSLGASAPPPEPPPKQDSSPFPEIDIGMLQKLSGLASQGTIDKNQQTLLHALSPYIGHHRIAKLEKAMRAAKLAGFATNFLGR